MDRVAGPSTEHLPGAEIFRAGISDLLAQRETAAAALVRMAAPRLRAAGLDIPSTQDEEPAGHALYDLLSAEDRATAHSRYNALVARMASFARAAEHASTRRR